MRIPPGQPFAFETPEQRAQRRLKQFRASDAYLEMDEKSTTERMLRRMTDPELVETREVHKRSEARVNGLKSRHSL